MKKLFVLGSFLALFLLIAGCQSDSPVAPAEQDVSVDKVKLFSFTGENILTANGFVGVKLDWPAVRNVAGYKVIYYNLLSGKTSTNHVDASASSYQATNAMLQQEGSSCEITVQAYKLRKGAEIILYSGTQTFTYSGPYLDNVTFNATIIDNGSGNPPSVYIQNILPWAYQSNYRYAYTLFPSWGSQVSNGGIVLNENNLITDYLPLHYPFTTSDFVVVTLYNLSPEGAVTAVGNQKIFYNLN